MDAIKTNQTSVVKFLNGWSKTIEEMKSTKRPPVADIKVYQINSKIRGLNKRRQKKCLAEHPYTLFTNCFPVNDGSDYSQETSSLTVTFNYRGEFKMTSLDSPPKDKPAPSEPHGTTLPLIAYWVNVCPLTLPIPL